MGAEDREAFFKRMDDKFNQLCDHYFLCELLILAAGMMGAYTVTMRGNVFCNAQTMNIVMMGICLGKGDSAGAAYYLVPFSAYLGGALLATFLSIRLKHVTSSRYEVYIISGEMVIMLMLGFLPLSAPVQLAQIAVNFAASMQFATFRKSQEYPMATTFVTNHIRQIGTFLIKYKISHDKADKRKCLKHVRMLLHFFLGATILTALESLLQEKVIWLTLIPLGTCLAIIIRNNVVVAKNAAGKALAQVVDTMLSQS